MFDTMTMTKVIGAGCGTLLIFLLGAWAAEVIYQPHSDYTHGKQHAYVIEVEAETSIVQVSMAGEDAPDFEVLLAAADVQKGKKVFRKCGACHKLNGKNGVGPYLNGVVNKKKASVEGYAYSRALAEMASQSWTPENLNAFLESPRTYAPGTKMSFTGLRKPDERANLIAYLATAE